MFDVLNHSPAFGAIVFPNVITTSMVKYSKEKHVDDECVMR
jgi:hypothetical protein